MAWLQNLAGKAEDFLNKIDKNAANVLNEPSSDMEQPNVIEPPRESPLHFSETSSLDFINEIPSHDRPSEVTEVRMQESPIEMKETSASPIEEIFERPLRPNTSALFSSNASSYNNLEEQVNYEEIISKLEVDNQDLNKQILNLQHEYSELKNDYGNLQSQIETYRNEARDAHTKMEEYKARAQRILQEKEKLIQMNNSDSSDTDSQGHILITYNEELKKELQFQQDRNSDLNIKVVSLSKEIAILQQQYVSVHNANQQSAQIMQDKLLKERKSRANYEEECQLKTKEMQNLQLDLSNLHNTIKAKDNDIAHLRKQLHQYAQRGSGNEDVEARLHTLTQTLMHKQNTLETITSERNALKIQLEKLELNFSQLLKQKNRIVNINSNSDDSKLQQVPRLMEMSPLDAGVTRRVKHAYSTLDTISIRTGAFLRRYPLARIFVFCYMILLHIWVLIILFTYVPSIH